MRPPPVVLIVEDDPALRSVYRDALSVLGGYAVVAVEDGIDALRYIESATPAAILLDLDLPRLHGRDVQQELAAHPRTAAIPVVIVTGDPTSVNPSDAACVLKKPIGIDELIAAVRNCLRKAGIDAHSPPS